MWLSKEKRVHVCNKFRQLRAQHCGRLSFLVKNRLSHMSYFYEFVITPYFKKPLKGKRKTLMMHKTKV